jgi:hypothetical protein
MAARQPLSRFQLPEDRRSDRLGVLLLILGLFVIGASWLDWMW